jgi:hypothetical protein
MSPRKIYMNKSMDLKINMDDAREFYGARDPRSSFCDIYAILVSIASRSIAKLCQRVEPLNFPENSFIREGKLSQRHLVLARNSIFSEIWTKTYGLLIPGPDSGQNPMFNPAGRLIIRVAISQHSRRILA